MTASSAHGQPDLTAIAAVGQAWTRGDLIAVQDGLAAWAAAGGETDIEYAVQRVYADACLEKDTLTASVRKAEQLAKAAGDEVALARIAAAVIDALYSDWYSSRDARQWLDVLRGVAYARLVALPASHRLEIAAGVLAADLFGEALASAGQVAASVGDWTDASLDVPATVRGNALGYALEYFSGQRNWPPAHEIVERIDRLQLEAGFGDTARARVSARRGFYYHYRRGDYSGALEQSQSAVSFALRGGVARAAREAGITVTLCHLMRGEIMLAERALAVEEQGIPDGHLMLRANVHYERSWWFALQRDVVSAQRELDTACRLFAQIDEHGVMSLATPSMQAQLLLQVGEYASARRVFEMRTRRPDAWLVDIALIESLAALAQGDNSRAVAELRNGLSVAARIDIKGCLWACRPELIRLLELAKEHDIETVWVNTTIQARQLEANLP